jgi:hypothetical protein
VQAETDLAGIHFPLILIKFEEVLPSLRLVGLIEGFSRLN